MNKLRGGLTFGIKNINYCAILLFHKRNLNKFSLTASSIGCGIVLVFLRSLRPASYGVDTRTRG